MQVGEIRPATVDDFKQLLDIVFSHEGWESKPNKGGVKVWTKSIPSSPVKMIKLAVDFDDITALTLYDVLHDPDFRPIWDESMIEGLDIYKIDDFNDIGYYSLRCPRPLKNRDFVNQRSWGIFGDDHMIMNHTIDIEEMPVKKDFVRGVSYLTGYVVRRTDTGCSVHYITQNDPGGQVPKFILDKISCVIAPKVLEKIHNAALGYEEWKSKNRPNYKPWRGLGSDSKPLWPKSYQSCKASNSSPTLDTEKVSPNIDVSNSSLTSQNGRVETETTGQYGSLDSLAPARSDTPNTAASPIAEEIIRKTRHTEQRRSLLMSTKSFDNSCQSPATEPTREEMQHLNSPEWTTQPISSRMNHMTSRDPAMTSRDLNHVSYTGMTSTETSLITEDTRTPTLQGRMSGMQRTDSLDTAGSQISDLCHSLSQLTKGTPGAVVDGPRPPRSGSSASSRGLVPPGSFASITLSAHPIDPDCCTRVSRHVMGAYGGACRNTPARMTPNSLKSRPHKQKVATIPEKSEHRVKKSPRDPEGLESSTLKFFSKMSHDKSHHKKKKKHLSGKTRAESSGLVAARRENQRTESR
ncbi:hypothetical protein ACHWQZ_G001882 [Mnemiopsis leidyi]